MSEHVCLTCKNCLGWLAGLIPVCDKSVLQEYLDSQDEECKEWTEED